MEAFEVLTRRYPSVELLVLGAGMTEEIVRASFPEDLRGRVRWRPGTESELARESPMDVLILPSPFEGTPQTLIEETPSGLPSSPRLLAPRDVIQHERTDCSYPPRRRIPCVGVRATPRRRFPAVAAGPAGTRRCQNSVYMATSGCSISAGLRTDMSFRSAERCSPIRKLRNVRSIENAQLTESRKDGPTDVS